MLYFLFGSLITWGFFDGSAGQLCDGIYESIVSVICEGIIREWCDMMFFWWYSIRMLLT